MPVRVFSTNCPDNLLTNNQAVIVETLKTTNVLKNRRLAHHIADAGWNSFVTKLEYKAKEAGETSGQTCHAQAAASEVGSIADRAGNSHKERVTLRQILR
ncbi:transposase [Xenorhabdus thuongxuanensis]|uniref:Transposase n=1 Tax=Xenorhabdus thuongxuanensis TaxID=1873484 RepID=A0A1Q5TXZ7_9GAMM|nr:transposase [Xenorhabdus thuongxuanensis]